jgi:hypothetical protein
MYLDTREGCKYCLPRINAFCIMYSIILSMYAPTVPRTTSPCPPWYEVLRRINDWTAGGGGDDVRVHLPPPSNCAICRVARSRPRGFRCFRAAGMTKTTVLRVSSQGQGCGEDKNNSWPELSGRACWPFCVFGACVYRVRLFGSQYVGWSDLSK